MMSSAVNVDMQYMQATQVTTIIYIMLATEVVSYRHKNAPDKANWTNN